MFSERWCWSCFTGEHPCGGHGAYKTGTYLPTAKSSAYAEYLNVDNRNPL